MPTLFSVRGPFDIPFYRGKGGRTITSDNVKEFWQKYRAFAEARGCYVFGVRAGKGYTPAYVGKATKTFKQEVFASHKLSRYQQFMADYKSGTPVLFLVPAPVKKGAPNVAHMTELERFLIQVGMAANPDLLNIKGTKEADWGIMGLLRGGKGKPSASARDFRKMMKLRE